MVLSKNVEAIELCHLRYFLAAAEQGSFRKAGIGLGLSQSAVSRCIADLEDQIGASLFHRHSWGVSQTYAGRRFLRRAREAMRSIAEGAYDVALAGRSEQGRIRIGVYSSIASGFLAELLGTFGQRHGQVTIELVDGNPADHVVAIRNLSLDVAFVAGTRDWPGSERTPLWEERVFAVLPAHHPLANRKELEWRDLHDETFVVSQSAPGQEIHAYLVRYLADLGRHPEIKVQHTSRDNLIALVALGQGLTVVSEAMTSARFAGVVYKPIVGELLPFSAVWSTNNDNPAFRRLLSLARSIAISSDYSQAVSSA